MGGGWYLLLGGRGGFNIRGGITCVRACPATGIGPSWNGPFGFPAGRRAVCVGRTVLGRSPKAGSINANMIYHCCSVWLMLTPKLAFEVSRSYAARALQRWGS